MLSRCGLLPMPTRGRRLICSTVISFTPRQGPPRVLQTRPAPSRLPADMTAPSAHLSVEEAAVTVSMRVMSAGDGYKYLLRTVAAADGDRSLSTPLTRYYTEVGNPPGRWLGAGIAALGGGEVGQGAVV